jgi:drug/metabolite transporter (DMT)-like permease
VPVTVVLMAWGFLHERPDAMEAIGIVLIVLGLLAVSGIRLRHTPAPSG